MSADLLFAGGMGLGVALVCLGGVVELVTRWRRR